MNCILYTNKTFLYFFHSHTDGLMLKCKKNGRWEEGLSLCRNALDGFFVYKDENEAIHILCADKENNIVYIHGKNFSWNNYILSKINNDITPLQFHIAKAGTLINFFYTALYKGEVILVHCVMGKNAKPEIIDTLFSASDFHINSSKIYYTNKNKALGFRDFSDSKPGSFVLIEQDALYPYHTSNHGNEYILYKKDDFLYFNKQAVFKDSLAEAPILIQGDNSLSIQWKSGIFVRYITSFNNGATWSAPMRFIGSGEQIYKFLIDCGSGLEHFYGQKMNPEPIIYGKSNLFFIEAPYQKDKASHHSGEEYKRLRLMLDMQKNEIKALKSKIKMLENK